MVAVELTVTDHDAKMVAPVAAVEPGDVVGESAGAESTTMDSAETLALVALASTMLVENVAVAAV